MYLLGRRLSETMLVWETADEDTSLRRSEPELVDTRTFGSGVVRLRYRVVR